MRRQTELLRKALVGGIVAVTAAAAIGVSGCSAGASSDAKEYGDPVGFVVPVADAENAVWKVDYVNEELPDDYVLGNWRMSIDEFDPEKIAVNEELGLNTEVSREGMDTLKTMGGADFTANEFDWILAQAKERAGVDPDKITVMDLRGEDHGLIDGDVFMYWIKDNYVNEGRTTAEVTEVEKGLLEDLKAQDTVEMYQTDDNWSAAVEEPMVSYDNPVIQTEEEFVKEKGCDYVRFATTNHFRPDDGTVDEFIAFMKDLPEDEWLYMHCYAGEGRTTAFMVMTDIYKNYDVASFDDIAARQGLIGPVDVRTEPLTTGKAHYKKKASVERRVFLQNFYEFAQETNFEGESWTEWARDHNISLEYYPEV